MSNYLFIAIGQTSADFKSYIAAFKIINKDSITRSNLQHKSLILLSSIIDQYSCNYNKEELKYRSKGKIVTKNFNILFLCVNSCCIHTTDTPDYKEILMVYNKKGKLIDHKVIGCWGDLWYFNYSGTREPFNLIIDQATASKEEFEKKESIPLSCQVETYRYSITEKGKIEKKEISKGSGEIAWNKEKLGIMLVKKEMTKLLKNSKN